MRKQRIHYLKKCRYTKRLTGGASLSTRRRSSSSSRHSSSSTISRSRSRKRLNVKKYVTILNKLADSKAIKKKDPVAGYILVPFVDAYGLKDSRSKQSRKGLSIHGGGGPLRAASISDELETDIPSARYIIELLNMHGRTLLGVHGPCWWHRVNHYERLVFMRRCNPQWALQRRRKAAVDFMLELPEAHGSRAHVEACMRAADNNENLAFTYLTSGIPAGMARPASASVVIPPPPPSTMPPECVGEVYVSQAMRFDYANIPVELARSMEYFASQYRSYCPVVHNAVPRGLTGAALTQIMSIALQAASALPPNTEQFRVPSNFDSPDTRLTFCEYAAIFFFTRDHMSPFSTYTLLNNTIDYFSVRNITAAEYVQRIRHPFVMLFYFALYKCPRIRDIQQAGLIPAGMRHLHRFMVVNDGVFQTYQSQTLQNLVTFYCFQSFSFTLADQNIGPFTNPVPRDNKYYIILLRIEVTDSTSARLMSHFSELIHENEAVVTPCVPYQVVGVQEFQPTDQDGFKQEIRNGSGFDYVHPFDHQIRGFLVVTIREERHGASMTGRAQVLRG